MKKSKLLFLAPVFPERKSDTEQPTARLYEGLRTSAGFKADGKTFALDRVRVVGMHVGR